VTYLSVSRTLLCGVIAIGAAGCSNPITGPSSSAAGPSTTTALAPSASPERFGNRTVGTVYVTSQGLYYDTAVVRDPLPMEGPFQFLDDGKTEFGPGDSGYLGGRWWEDTDGDAIQDPTDHYFLCPLLPPGRTQP
jgi:hypothetical protein